MGGSLLCAAGITAGVSQSHLLVPKNSTPTVQPGTPLSSSNTKIEEKTAPAVKVLNSPQRAQEGSAIPWSVNFETSNLKDFTIIDANEDEITWQMGSGYAEAPYSAKDPMDDWLITPGLAMDGGKAYTLSISLAANSAAYDERMEICYGSDNTVAAMTHVAAEPFVISGTDFYTVESVIVPNRDGKTYIGLHGISDADRYKILVKEISVKAGATGDVPAGVSNLTITSDDPYSLKADVSFDAPTTTMAGKTIGAISKIEVMRNGTLVKTFTSPAAGAHLSFTDNIPGGDTYTYSVTAYNNAGMGYTMTETAKVGAARPDAPETVYLQELEPGKMKLTWSPVTVDEDGNTIPAGMVEYLVVDNEMTVIGTTQDTEMYINLQGIQGQIFVELLVAAQTSVGGLGDARMSNVCAVGTPFDGATYRESFKNGNLDTLIGVGYEFGYVDYVGWDVADDTSFDNSEAIIPVVSSDGDNGFAFMNCEYRDTGASLFTGKITMPAEGPAVKFDIFNQSLTNIPDENLVELMVSEDGENWTVVDAATVFDHCSRNLGWNEIVVGLQQYAGKTIQLRWQVTIESFPYFLLDNIRIVSLPAKDLSLRRFTIPGYVIPGQTAEAEAEVMHLGASDAGTYNVNLYANGRQIASATESGLVKGGKATVTIPFEVTPVMGENVELYAEVALRGDAVADNNCTDVKSVRVELPKLPYVTDLTGNCDENGMVSLNWSEPAIASFSPGIYEGFEDGNDFTQEFKDWIFIDGDKKAIGGLMPSTIPGLVPGETRCSFFVMNQNEPSFTANLSAHTGDKFLASLFNFYGEQNDDWVITPELNGAAQVVSFWARSCEAFYAESMEVLYSFGGTNPSDFVKIVTVETVPGAWTEYQIPIPAGAKRFAVRNVSRDRMALFLDDFFFADATCPVGVTLEGYNVYCDAQKVGSTGKDERTFSHLGTNGSRTYAVTALYKDQGESKGSNNFEIDVNGGNSLITDINGGQGIIKEGNILRLVGHEGETLVVYSIDGTVQAKVENLPADYSMEMPAGIVIVKAGDSHRKIRF